MELRQIYGLLRRWAWLLILGMILGALSGYIYSKRQTPVYRASTKVLMIYPSKQTTTSVSSPNYQDLASIYMQMLSTQPVLDAVSKTIGYPVSGKAVQGQIISDPDIVQISATDSDPKRAALIANTLVKVLVQQNESYQTSRFTEFENSIQTQIDQVQSQSADLQKQIDQASSANLQDQIKQTGDQINSLQNEISALQANINTLSPTIPGIIQPTLSVADQTKLNEDKTRLAQLQPLLSKYQDIYGNLVVMGQPSTTGDGNKLAQMQKTLDLYQQMYLQLKGNLENVQLAGLQSTSTAQQIEPATVPGSPISPRTSNNTLLGGVVGLFIMGGIAFLLEYLDDTIKTPRDVKNALELPVLGYIGEIEYDDSKEPSLHVAAQPRSPVSEAFRTLRTNLEFAGVNSQVRTLLITSTGADEGKTTVAVNLAAIMAMGGKRVLLMDADMRKPKLHRFLGLSNRSGLSDILQDGEDPLSYCQPYRGVECLSVITSGKLPINPAELLGSERMDALLQSFKNSMDVIIIDCPPFIVADAQVLSAKADGTLVVIKPGSTHAGMALGMLEQLRESNTKILGVVFNNISRRFHYGYEYYHYYHYYRRGYPYYSERKVNTSESTTEK